MRRDPDDRPRPDGASGHPGSRLRRRRRSRPGPARWIVGIVCSLIVVAIAALACVWLIPGGSGTRVRSYPAVAVPAAVSTRPAAATVTPEQFGAVGDGQHDDGPAVQQALDAADGATVQLAAGATYLIRQSLMLPSHTTLAGPRSAVLAFTWTGLDSGDAGGPFYLGNADQRNGNEAIVLDGFTLRGAGDGLPRGPTLAGQPDTVPAIRLRHVNTFTIHDVDIGYSPSISVLYQGCFHGRLTDNHVHDSGRDGITGTFLDGATADIEVSDNTIERVGDDAIAVVGATVRAFNDTALPTDVKILDNTITGWDRDPNGMIIGRGIALLAVTDVEVRDNTIERTAGPGILIAGAPSDDSTNPLDGQQWYSDHVTVVDNRISGAGAFVATSTVASSYTGGIGVQILRAQSVVVQDNRIQADTGGTLVSRECVSCDLQSH